MSSKIHLISGTPAGKLAKTHKSLFQELETQGDELRDTASLLLVGRPRRALTPAQREFKDLSKGGVD
ncbi:MAG: hypothetical protein AUG08_07895 [Acidobacteria bacterium 13_1_20CM_2_55_15]|nr:MAG: hypothetical protein AUG08_07895 [Acidobacteria bacterium 13_1_20CM_2_55_15]